MASTTSTGKCDPTLDRKSHALLWMTFVVAVMILAVHIYCLSILQQLSHPSSRGATWVDLNGIEQSIRVTQDPGQSWENLLQVFDKRLQSETEKFKPRKSQ